MLNEYQIALVIGTAFLLLQAALCAVFVLRMRRFRAIVAELSEPSPYLRVSETFSLLAGKFPWLSWVDRQFPPWGEGPGNFTREDALRELDLRISADRSYVLLQRAGVMAPLLGVLITVGGFVALRLPDAGELQLQEILLAVTPLVAGVGVGAALAFINQWLLHFAGSCAESLRAEAREWFDAAIWQALEQPQTDHEAMGEGIGEALREMIQSIGASARQHQENAQAMERSTRVMQRATKGLARSLVAFRREIEHLPQDLAGLSNSVQSAVGAVDGLIPKGQEIVAGLDVSVSAFRGLVNHDFRQAVHEHKALAGDLAASTRQVIGSWDQLDLRCTNFAVSLASHADAVRALNRSVEHHILPVHESLHAAISRLSDSGLKILDRVDAFSDQFVSTLDQLQSLGPDAAASVSAFQEAIMGFRAAVQHQFAPTATQHAQTAESLLRSVQGIEQGAKKLESGSVKLTQILVAHDSFSDCLKQSLESRILPAHDDMRDAASSFRNATRDLTKHISTLRTTLDDSRKHVDVCGPALAQALQDLAPAAAALRKTVEEQLAEAARGHEGAIASLADSAGQLRSLSEGLRGSGGLIERLLQEQSRLTEDLAWAGETWKESLDDHVLPAQRSLSEAVASFTGSADRLAAFVQHGVDPATERLGELEQSVQVLSQAVAGLRQFADTPPDIARLRNSLAEAAQVAEAISELPDRIRFILEELVDHHHPNGFGRMFRVLGGRPR